MFLPSKALVVIPEVEPLIEKSKKDVQKTIKITKGLLEEYNQDASDSSYVFVYQDDTPCGKIRVYVQLKRKFSVWLEMYNDWDYVTCRLDITEECQEFEKKFKDMHMH